MLYRANSTRRLRMRNRFLRTAAVLIMAFRWYGLVLGAQAPSGTKSFDPKQTNTDAAIKAAAEITRAADEARKTFKAPKTPWGEPDLRGYYLNLSYTPLERPKELGDKALYTPDEALAAFKKAVERTPRLIRAPFTTTGKSMGWTPGKVPSVPTCIRRSSSIRRMDESRR